MMRYSDKQAKPYAKTIRIHSVQSALFNNDTALLKHPSCALKLRLCAYNSPHTLFENFADRESTPFLFPSRTHGNAESEVLIQTTSLSALVISKKYLWSSQDA